MNPDRNPARRALRSRALNRRVDCLLDQGRAVYFTDASFDHQAATGIASFLLLNSSESASVSFLSPPTPTALEEYAIALAIEHATLTLPPSSPIYIFTDSQSALRNFIHYTTHPATTALISSSLSPSSLYHFTLVWVPGHAGMSGNARADALTRVHSPGPPMPWPNLYHPPTVRTSHRAARAACLRSYRLARSRYPLPPRA